MWPEQPSLLCRHNRDLLMTSLLTCFSRLYTWDEGRALWPVEDPRSPCHREPSARRGPSKNRTQSWTLSGWGSTVKVLESSLFNICLFVQLLIGQTLYLWFPWQRILKTLRPRFCFWPEHGKRQRQNQTSDLGKKGKSELISPNASNTLTC